MSLDDLASALASMRSARQASIAWTPPSDAHWREFVATFDAIGLAAFTSGDARRLAIGVATHEARAIADRLHHKLDLALTAFVEALARDPSQREFLFPGLFPSAAVLSYQGQRIRVGPAEDAPAWVRALVPSIDDKHLVRESRFREPAIILGGVDCHAVRVSNLLRKDGDL